MLLRFRVENYRSLRDEQELSLVASALTEHPENSVHIPTVNGDVLRVAAIYGANASGKTNLWRAMRFMNGAVAHSQRNWEPGGGIPRTPFLLDPECVERPSLFECDFVLNDVRYQYGFVVDSIRVMEEWLYAYPNGRKQVWFTRDSNAERPVKPGKVLTGTRASESIIRSNSLFLSAAAQNNHKMLLPLYQWFSQQIRQVSPGLKQGCHMVTQEMISGHHAAITSLLGAADLGIVGLTCEQHEPDAFEEQMALTMGDLLAQHGKISTEATARDLVKWPQDIMLQHQSDKSKDGIKLPFDEESGGTQTWFSLIGPMIATLASGGLLCVDELDASLHPLLSLEITRIFNSPERNPKNAQLIFNTHDTNLLGSSLLRRDQIWFTEKDHGGATHLYPLTDFKPRQHENLERGYLQGRYGAIPFIGSNDILHESASTDG